MSCGCSENFMMGGGSISGGKAGKRLEKDTKEQLYAKAKKYDIKGRSKMDKAELVKAVRAAQVRGMKKRA